MQQVSGMVVRTKLKCGKLSVAIQREWLWLDPRLHWVKLRSQHPLLALLQFVYSPRENSLQSQPVQQKTSNSSTFFFLFFLLLSDIRMTTEWFCINSHWIYIFYTFCISYKQHMLLPKNTQHAACRMWEILAFFSRQK